MNLLHPPPQREITEMDGLRGLAILVVLVAHTLPHYTGNLPIYDQIGQLGVPLFFAVSGFCISYSIFFRKFRGRATSCSDFARRRFWRIYPPYILAVAIYFVKVVAYAAVKGHGYDAGELGRMLFFNVTLTQVFMGDTAPVNPAFWSLCVEFQFYLVVGTVLFAAEKGGKRWAVGLLSAAAFCLLLVNAGQLCGWLHIDGQAWFMALPHYAPHFLFGAVLSWQHVRLGVPGGVRRRDDLMLAGAGTILATAPMGWLIALLLVLAANKDRWNVLALPSMILDWKPLRYLGERSYSIYLIHGLGITALSGIGAAQFAKNPTIGTAILVLSWMLAVGMGLVYFHFVERHFLRSVAKAVSPVKTVVG